jgi:hypothetical protein
VKKLLVLVVVAIAAGVGGGWLLFERLEDDPEPAVAAPTWNTCTNQVEGYSIDYPAAWHTDHPSPELACVFFDPRRFEVPEASDFTGTALEVVRETADWDFRSRTRVMLGDREAIRFEALREEGLVTYGYLIEEGGRTFSVVTTANRGVDYTPWRQIVDKAARTLRFSRPETRAVEGSNVVPPQTGLPEPVARKRAQIWKAARGGDYEQVASFADPEGFEYTFGGAVPGGPAAFWRRIDQTTDERPIETLAAILELPYVYQAESKIYVWPDAFTRKASTLTAEEKAELSEAIGAEGLKLYEQLGDYLGYRAGIREDGDWVFYVAGD